MGTNYYTTDEEFNRCKYCKRPPLGCDVLHIGKSSGGWTFSFQGHTHPAIRSFLEWQNFLKDKVIWDESGEIISYEDFVQLVEQKQADTTNKNHTLIYYRSTDHFLDGERYSFTMREFG